MLCSSSTYKEEMYNLDCPKCVSTDAPIYNGMMKNYKKNMNERMEFFICNDNIERCVKGTKRKWVLSKSAIPTIWPVKSGTALSQQEVLAFEALEFRLP